MKKTRKSQAFLEYTILFAAVIIALLGSLFIANSNDGFSSHLRDMATAMAGNSLEASTIGGW